MRQSHSEIVLLYRAIRGFSLRHRSILSAKPWHRQLIEEDFLCFVNHQDYILKPGCDAHAFKARALDYVEQRDARYPGEHNVGSIYHASPDYETHLRRLDPTNTIN